MIKIISRVLGRKFQAETARGLAKEFKLKCFTRDLLSGNRLPEDVIDYQWPKCFLK